jgi:hypothetical protein
MSDRPVDGLRLGDDTLIIPQWAWLIRQYRHGDGCLEPLATMHSSRHDRAWTGTASVGQAALVAVGPIKEGPDVLHSSK